MAEIPLTNTTTRALVDDADHERLSAWRWRLSRKGYVIRWEHGPNGTRREIQMHREVLQPEAHLFVDHINGIGHDNRRANLRACTGPQNAWNSVKPLPRRAKITSRFRGVHWHIRKQQWCASVRHEGVRVHLGTFVSELDAARAYDQFIRANRGEFARPNNQLSA
jgi:hypothetical protein